VFSFSGPPSLTLWLIVPRGCNKERCMPVQLLCFHSVLLRTYHNSSFVDEMTSQYSLEAILIFGKRRLELYKNALSLPLKYSVYPFLFSLISNQILI
jgi:hypothetical protein